MAILTEDQLDALKEIINIGVGKAAGTLNELIESHITLQVPLIKAFSLNELDKEFGDFLTEELSLVNLSFKGPFSGTSSLVFPPESALKLVNLLIDSEDAADDFDTLKIGTLLEVGNILLNGVMGSLSNILNTSVEFAIPTYEEDSISRMLKGQQLEKETTILFIKTHFQVEAHEIVGDIIILFEVGAFDTLLSRLNALTSS